MKNELTPDRIEAAREMLTAEQLFYSQAPDLVEQYDTALAALDLAEQFRWRDPGVELPEVNCVVLDEICERVYIDEDGFWRSDDLDRNSKWIALRVRAWMPLPRWEGER